MASRLKEDERNERAIRNLLKLPENRRCINCNSLGPQYVCTSFWTFVCTTCSGIHREFTHRVKSVSMAKFSSQEVSALQGGGNASAKEIYFKEWDAQRHSFPDSSNIERLRDFIKHVYVDRRYTGERSFDKTSRAKTGEPEDRYQGGSRSPPFENERPSPGGRSDDRSSKNSYDERRSPGYDQDFRRSPAGTDIVNDWRREDRFGNGRRSDGGSKVEGDRQRDLDMSSPPIARPVRDILGDSVSPLRVIEPPRANGARPPDVQRTTSSSSLASCNGIPAELRTESSLIDFDAVPEPPSTAPVPQTQQSAPPAAPFVAPPTTSVNEENWANFDSVPEVKASHAPPSNANFLDVLSELSVSASMPGGVGSSILAPGASLFPSSSNPPAESTGNAHVSPFGTSTPAAAAPLSHSSPFASGRAQTPTPGPPFSAFPTSAQNINPQQNLFANTGNQPPAQSYNHSVGGSLNNQQWNSSLIGNAAQVASSAPVSQSQVTHGVDVKSTAKKELPADLFSSSYSSFGAPWHPAPAYGVGLNVQYNVPVPMPSISSNPFDVNEPSPVQAVTFPSMAPPSSIQRTSSLGTPWMPPQGPPPYGSSAIPSGQFMGQVPTNMPPPSRPQAGGFGYDDTLFSSSNQSGGLYSAVPNTFSSNPFG